MLANLAPPGSRPGRAFTPLVGAQQLARHDTKYQRLLRHLGQLEQAGHRKIIIFTQFQDTQDYLVDRLTNRGGKSVTRISGPSGMQEKES